MTDSTRILLVDDHPLVREGLRARLAPDIDLGSSARNRRRRAAFAREHAALICADGRRHETGQRHQS